MKKFKKLVAVMLAAIMVLSMGSMSVWADGDYTITIDDTIKNGVVTADITSANANDTVTLTVTPYDGYKLKDLTVTYNTSDTLTPTLSSGNKYVFNMPAYDVTISATFEKEDSDTYVLTIENDTSDYTYMVYQIFTGDVSENGTTLSNIKWGSDIAAAGKSALISKYCSGNADATAADVAATIVSADNAQDFAEALATNTSSYLTGGKQMSYNSSTGTYYVTDLAAGYYMVINTNVPGTGTDISYSNYIVQVVADITMEPKSDVPTVDKTVKDTNDSANTSGTGIETADYDIGDSVPFTLTATLPDNFSEYTSYKLVFHDTLSTGLTYDADSLKITVYSDNTLASGTVVGSGYYTINTSPTDGHSLDVTITNVKALKDGSSVDITVTSNSVIVVEYTATLGKATNKYSATNSVYLEYSNDPNSDNTGITTTDLTTVYYYTLTVSKTDDNDGSLPGAGFTLYKAVKIDATTFNSNKTQYYTMGTSGEMSQCETDTVYDSGTTYFIQIGDELGKVSGSYTLTSFEWAGLDDGNYVLIETTTPDGYNTIDPVYFTITATHTEDTNGTASLDSLTVTQTDSSWVSLTSATQTFSANTNDGSIKTTVINNSGSLMPSTGGMGTTILYIIGAILVIGAAVILVTRRRMANRA